MPVEVTAMKNTPSKRASLLIAAWYRCSSSGPGGLGMFVLTSSTMPARGDCYWRKSDSDPVQAAGPTGRNMQDHARTVTGSVSKVFDGTDRGTCIRHVP